MRRNALNIMVVFMLLFTLQASASVSWARGEESVAAENGWVVYSDPVLGFQFEYPETWYRYNEGLSGHFSSLHAVLVSPVPEEINSAGELILSDSYNRFIIDLASVSYDPALTLQEYADVYMSDPFFYGQGTLVNYGENSFVVRESEVGKQFLISAGSKVYEIMGMPNPTGDAARVLASFRANLTIPSVNLSEDPRNSEVRYTLRPEVGNQLMLVPSFRMPWDSGSTYIHTSGPHGYRDTNYRNCAPYNTGALAGIDFNMKSTNEVLAVAGGTITYFYDGTDPNDGVGKYVQVDHGGGFVTQYWHLASVDQWVKDNMNVSNAVQQGQVLGRAGKSGNQASEHLHLQIRSGGAASTWHGVAIDGYTVRSIVDANNTNNGLNYQGTLIRGTESLSGNVDYNCGAVTRTARKYLGNQTTIVADVATGGPVYSTNTRRNGGGSGGDTTYPDGDITAPSNGATVNSGTVRIEGWGSDSGGSGFDHAHFTAYFNGAWRVISPEFTSTSFGFDWDMCAAGVPNGSVTLGLDLWDKAGNDSYSPRGTKTFNKNYNCGGGGNPTGTWKADYYDTVDRWWDNNNSGNYRCTESNVGGPTLDKNYGTGTACGMDPDGWVAEYTATINFPAGNYVFLAEHDDGLKIWLNGQNIADYGGSGNDKACPARYLSGNNNMKVMLREDGGDARVKLTWTTDTSVCITRPGAPSLANPGANATVGRYDDVNVSWNPVSGATQYYVEFNGGPGWGINEWTTSTSKFIGGTFWGGTYQWRVKANNSAGDSEWSETRTLYRRYGAPSNLASSNVGQTQATLSWTASADAPPGNIAGYRVFRNGSHVGTTDAYTVGYTDNSLVCGSTYTYTVKAYNGSLESNASNSTVVNTASCQAGAPTLTNPVDGAVFNEGEAIVLQWNDTADEYSGEITGGPTPLSFGWQTANSINLGPQWAGYNYAWKVKARNYGTTESPWSGTRTFQVRPAKPGGLTATVPSCSQARLNWTDNSGNETGYRVYRDDSVVATLGANVASYTDDTVSEGSYAYTVTAFRGSIESEHSNSAVASVQACPPGNDLRAGAYAIGALPYTNSQSTRGAAVTDDDPFYPIGNNPGSSVWYRFVPPADGLYSVDTFGSSYDTVIHVYQSGNGLHLLQGDDDDSVEGVTQSKVILRLNEGSTYLISITHYGGGAGGNLVLHADAAACPADTICAAVTAPNYRAASSAFLNIYNMNLAYYSGGWTDSYGIAQASGLTPGQYYHAVVSSSSWNMVQEMRYVYPGMAFHFHGPALAVRDLALRDPQGNPASGNVFLGNDFGIFYMGETPGSYAMQALASFGTYDVYFLNQASHLLAVGQAEIDYGTTAPYTLDMSTQPVKSVQLNLDGYENAYLIYQMRSGVGLYLELLDGEAASVSFPPGQGYRGEVLVEIPDTVDGGYWQYDYWNLPGWTTIESFRETVSYSLGGTLQFQSYHRPVYRAGETANLGYSVLDAYGNRVTNIYYLPPYEGVNQQAGSRQEIAENGEVKGGQNVFTLPEEGPAYRAELPDAHRRWLLQRPPITVKAYVYDANNTLVTSSDAGTNTNGGITYTVPSAPAFGNWRVEFKTSHLGIYQGETIGQSSFKVSNARAPDNDDFSYAYRLTGPVNGLELDTSAATQGYDDPALTKCGLVPPLATVWYSYTPPVDGTIHVNTIGSDYDTVLGVWTGTRGNLTPVACNDDRQTSPHDQDSELYAPVSAQATYYILVGEWTPGQMVNGLSTDKQPGETAGVLGLDPQPRLLSDAGNMVLNFSFASALPARPELYSPDSTLVIRRPVYTWKVSPYATAYTLQVFSMEKGKLIDVQLDASVYCNGTTCHFPTDVDQENGEYTWKVRAENQLAVSAWSDIKTYQVQSTLSVLRQLFSPIITR